MRIFIFLAAAAVLVIATEGIPLEDKTDSFSQNDEDSSQKDKQDSVLKTEETNEDKIVIESRHHPRGRPWKGKYPPPGQFHPVFFPPPPPVYIPSYYPYPYPPFNPYARPPPPYYVPTGPEEGLTTNPPMEWTELASPSTTASPPAPIVDNEEEAISNNMTVTVGGQNLTISQVTCLLDFFLHPSAGTTLENCINNNGTEIDPEIDPEDNNNEEDSYTAEEQSVDQTEDDQTEQTTWMAVPTMEESETMVVVDEGTESEMTPAPAVETFGHGIYVSPGILPQISIVGKPIKQNEPGQLINNLFGGINNLLGTIVSGVKQPPTNYQHQYYPES